MDDEYISRKAAFNTILKLVPKIDDDGYCWVIRGDAAMAIDSVPAVDVAPRCPHYIRNIHDQGDDSLCKKWGCEVKEVAPVRYGRDISDEIHGHIEFKCSLCGCELSTVYGGDNDCGMDGGYFNFCPNCGAKMDGGETERPPHG